MTTNYGRIKLSTNLAPTLENIPVILSRVFPDHIKNKNDSEYLYEYYTGKQDILDRVKVIRPEVNNKIVVNHSLSITDFKVGYVFGGEVKLVRRGKDLVGKSGGDDNIAKLSQYLDGAYKKTSDRELAEWIFATGAGYRAVLPENGEIPFVLDVYSPLDTFVVYSSEIGQKPIICGHYATNYNADGSEYITLGVYTEEIYVEYELASPIVVNNTKTVDIVSVENQKDVKPNPMGMLPIIEYPANPARMGCFETVKTMLDAINLLASDRVNGVEQFVQAYWKFKNCDVEDEDIPKIAQLGAIKIKSQPGVDADAELVSSELDQSQVQTLVDDAYQTILIICSMPDRMMSAGGNTCTSMEIGQGWVAAEDWARNFEAIFDRSEKRFLSTVLKILNESAESEVKDLSLSEIEIKFTRNKLANMMVKAQTGLNLKRLGVHPRIVLETINLFADPENVYIESKEYIDKMWEQGERTPQTQNVGENLPKNAE